MFAWVMKLLSACWRPVERYAHIGTESAEAHDTLLWFRDLSTHTVGDFSIAVVQANEVLEDQSQVESGPYGTFVGVYDGHGGPEAARYVNDNLFLNLKKIAEEYGEISSDVLKKAFRETEEGFLSVVSQSWLAKPQVAAVGACCLVGVIHEATLYIASLGDSRAVLGSFVKAGRPVAAVQLSTEHNASIDTVRAELRALHPDDPHIVVMKHGVWRVKGIIQVSKSIGDAYLKRAEFNRDPLMSKFRLPDTLKKPVLSAEPSVDSYKLRPEDQFVIFASDGLWEHLSNEEAVDIVHKNPRSGIARRLIKAALQKAARKREMRYVDLKRIGKGIRRHFHDDITVIVVFLDHQLFSQGSNRPSLSTKVEMDDIGATSKLLDLSDASVQPSTRR